MELIWILSILYAAISTASYIDSGYSKTKRSLTNGHISLVTREVPVVTTRSIIQSENDSETPLNNLERRGRSGKKESKKKKQLASNKSNPQLQHQRSGSSFQLSNSASANSLGVEDKGVSKPIPKRNSDKRLGSDHSSELLGSLGAKSVGDLRMLDHSRGSSENLFRWANPQGAFGSGPSTTTHQTRVGGFSPPMLQHHPMMGSGFGTVPGFANSHSLNPGFGSGSGLHTLPEQAPSRGFQGSPPSPPRPNSMASSKSGSRMSIDFGEEVQGPLRMQRLGGVNDLTMMDTMPYVNFDSRASSGRLSP